MKVLCITGSRADFGGIEATYKALVKCGVDADLRTSSLDRLNGDVLDNIEIEELETIDLVVILGDRFEILRVAVELYIEGIPIAHLSGGDITEGSQDDSMRHAITKLSHLHFPTNEESAKRIIQMGEEPWRVKIVGYPGVDALHPDSLPAWAPSEFILSVWHPNTLESEENCLLEAGILANALEVARGDLKVIVIGPNKDAGGEKIADFMKQWAEFTGNIYKGNLPRNQYLGLLQNAECLVGNSSSGFYEAPSFGTPVVNIGDRQKGRIEPENVFWARISIDDIDHMIKTALIYGRYEPKNPYRTGNAAEKIAETIAKIKDPKKLLVKKFYSIKH